MNTAHLHLMVNHLPLVGLGFAIIFTVIAMIIKNEELRKLSWWFYIIIGLLSILPIVTGDGAGEILLTYPGISNDAIEYHETWGYFFFYGMLLNGLLAIAALWFTRKKPGLLKKLNMAILIVALITLALAYQAGSTGGKIRHPEIEQGNYKL